ncbi:MAG: SH3 domain-containing protein [Clostridiales bacterium]|nr:SH3 domain-containing protein [Clostridiales bacterium]
MKMQRKWKYVLTGTLAAVVLAVNAWAANVVANTDVNVRSAPDNNASIVCSMRKHATAEKLGTSGNWIHVNYKGKTGYVYKKYLTVQDTEQPEGLTTVYVTANALNVRTAPDATSAKLGTLAKNTAVQGKYISKDWFEIEYKGHTGYISTKYITATRPATVKTTTVYTTANLWVRTKPDKTTGEKLGVLKKGTAVESYGKTNGWHEIRYNGKTAYISGKYVTTTKPATVKTTTVYTTANLRVRAAATTKSERLGVLPKGTAVTTYGKANGWYEIRYNGKKAYICAKYTTTTKPTTTVKTTTVYTTADLWIRAEASMNGKKLGVLKKDTAVETYGRANGWYEIRYNGKKAYIGTKYTTTTRPATVKTTTVYTTADLWIRAEASMNGKKLGVLKKDTAVETYGKANGWYEIRYNGAKAYIGAKYTTTTKPQAGLLGSALLGADGTVETEELPDEVG